jgi:GTP-binding protein EngB required for normal cell division
MLPISLEEFQAAEVALSLPRIVVVGDESVGKSSILERIATCPLFPRDEDFCTRMPFVLKLQQGPAEPIRLCCKDCHGAVLADANGDAIEWSIDWTDDMARLEPLGRGIKDRMRLIIEAATSEVDDGQSILTGLLIEINIQNPLVHSMELIDLPGLVQGAAREQGLQLIREYLDERNDTLVVCVVSDQIASLRTSQTLAEVWQRPYLHSRTVVALTHVDKTSDNFCADPSRLLRRVNDGQLGFDFTPCAIIPVINLRKEGETFEEATAKEQTMFEQVNASLAKAGLQDLLNSLAHLAEAHLIEHWLPRQRQEIEECVVEHDTRLAQMGPSPELQPVDRLATQLAELIRFIDFLSVEALLGTPPPLQPEPPRGWSAIVHAIMRAHSYEYALGAIAKLRQPETVAEVVRKAVSGTQLHRTCFLTLLQEFRPSVPEERDVPLVARSMMMESSVSMTQLEKAVYDWLIVPLISYLEGKYVTAFEASGAELPSVLKETETCAKERQAETDMRERRIALLNRLNEWNTSVA